MLPPVGGSPHLLRRFSTSWAAVMTSPKTERTLLLSSLVAGALWAMTLHPVGRTTPTALVATTPCQHLKDIPLGSTAKVTFELIANRATRIVAVLTSCNCTTAALNSSEFSPGDCAKLDVAWTLAAKEGDQSTAITIVYFDETTTPRDATLKRLPLQLRANAVAQLTEVPNTSAIIPNL